MLRTITLTTLFLLIPGVLFGQTSPGFGAIHLEVRDASGGVVAASGRLRNLTTGLASTFKTDAKGVYDFTNLLYSSYQIQLSKSGFATQILQLEVQSATPVARTVTLELGSQATSIDVVAVTPLPGMDLSRDQIPFPVQTASSKDLEYSGSLDLADLLNKRLNGVYVNENQENPYQPDINYRGYTASPLLGTPQGLSIYTDGVRQNQPFGDVVSWDLIPKIAIGEMALMPGSDPLYGLNTLGGAVSIQTKSGLSHPGTSLQATGGQYGRRAVEFEHGGSNARGLNWYVGGNLYREDGWRRLSPSEVRQSFGKLGWLHGKTSLALSFSYAANWLTGNGLQDFRFLQQNYSSVNTVPDTTKNRSPAITLTARHDLSSNVTLSGVAYYRYIRADTVNGNLNSNSYTESLYNPSAGDIAALTSAGYKGFPTTGNATTEPFPYWRCIAQGLEHSAPFEKCNAIVISEWTKQNNYGLSGLAAWRTSRNHFAAGIAWDRSSMTFQQSVQFAYLNSDRTTLTTIPFFADGTNNSNGTPVDDQAYLHGINNTPGFYATDTLTLGKWNFTASGRYNRTTVDNVDRLPPGFPGAVGSNGGRASLTGNSVYGRFNPAAGLTYAASRLLNGYFSYSESSRAPSSIELGCSNPNDPCNLPNALVSDPPLKQVVTRTLEAGVRSAGERRLRWSAGWFRAVNYDDLLFVSSDQTGFGYFTNFGKTRREGAEASLSGRIQHFTLGGSYTFLNATYQSPQTVNGTSNSSSQNALAGFPGDGDTIDIVPGDRIPLAPHNLFKAYADYQPTSKLSVDLDFRAVSRSIARGNENNLYRPDGIYYLGQGSSAGYGVVNLGARYQAHRRVQLFVEINNLLNHHYYTAAQLGTTPYDNAGQFASRAFPVNKMGDYPVRSTTFLAPGAPVDVFGGMKFTF